MLGFGGGSQVDTFTAEQAVINHKRMKAAAQAPHPSLPGVTCAGKLPQKTSVVWVIGVWCCEMAAGMAGDC